VTVSNNLSEENQKCNVKVRLAAQYESATAVFSGAVTELRRKVGTSSTEEYDRLGRLADDARVKSERARLELESHIAEHRC
jgi:hypothetical protein